MASVVSAYHIYTKAMNVVACDAMDLSAGGWGVISLSWDQLRKAILNNYFQSDIFFRLLCFVLFLDCFSLVAAGKSVVSLTMIEVASIFNNQIGFFFFLCFLFSFMFTYFFIAVRQFLLFVVCSVPKINQLYFKLMPDEQMEYFRDARYVHAFRLREFAIAEGSSVALALVKECEKQRKEVLKNRDMAFSTLSACAVYGVVTLFHRDGLLYYCFTRFGVHSKFVYAGLGFCIVVFFISLIWKSVQVHPALYSYIYVSDNMSLVRRIDSSRSSDSRP